MKRFLTGVATIGMVWAGFSVIPGVAQDTGQFDAATLKKGLTDIGYEPKSLSSEPYTEHEQKIQVTCEITPGLNSPIIESRGVNQWQKINPDTWKVTLSAPAYNGMLEIVDPYGRRHYYSKIPTGQTFFNVDTHQLGTGIYFVVIRDKQSKSTQKIVVSK